MTEALFILFLFIKITILSLCLNIREYFQLVTSKDNTVDDLSIHFFMFHEITLHTFLYGNKWYLDFFAEN